MRLVAGLIVKPLAEIGARPLVDIDEGDPRALAHEAFDQGGADPRAAACNQHAAAGEIVKLYLGRRHVPHSLVKAVSGCSLFHYLELDFNMWNYRVEAAILSRSGATAKAT
jgi:hypothetical protein